MSPDTILDFLLSILNSPMSPVEFTKGLCRPVKFKVKGP